MYKNGEKHFRANFGTKIDVLKIRKKSLMETKQARVLPTKQKEGSFQSDKKMLYERRKYAIPAQLNETNHLFFGGGVSQGSRRSRLKHAWVHALFSRR